MTFAARSPVAGITGEAGPSTRLGQLTPVLTASFGSLGFVLTGWATGRPALPLMAAAAGTFVLLITLLTALRNRKGLLGPATCTIGLSAFYVKWVIAVRIEDEWLAGSPDPDSAVLIFTLFAVTFSLAYALGRSPILSRPIPRCVSSAPAHLALLIPLIALLLYLRVYLANNFGVGVPGQVPRPLPVPRLGGALYYTSLSVPLIAACYWLTRSRASKSATTMAIVTLGSYSLVGASLGYRSYAVNAVAVAIYAGWYRRCVAERRSLRRVRVSTLVVALAGLMAVLATVSLASGERSHDPTETSGLAGSIDFLTSRVGGVEYLAPVVGQIDRTGGPRPGLASPVAWDNYLRSEVYTFDRNAVHSLAGTGVGWLYAFAGPSGVVVFAFLAGRAFQRVDASWLAAARTLPGLALLLAWLNLFLEGTLLPSTAILIVSLAVSAILDGLWKHPFSGRSDYPADGTGAA